jgi:hypothetical protein
MFRRLVSVSVLRRQRLALLIGPNRVGFYLRTETESSFRNIVFNKKTGRMCKMSIIVLLSHCHKLLDLIYTINGYHYLQKWLSTYIKTGYH